MERYNPDATDNERLSGIKSNEVKEYFEHIARRYDLANSVMSFGRHHYWRRFAVSQTRLKPGGRVLDLCCGTGMITADLAKRVGEGKVIGLDFCSEMLAIAKIRLKRSGLSDRAELVQGDASRLPFPADSFDCVMIGYGLRNVFDPQCVLNEAFRVLKPGGKIVVLETAKPSVPVIRDVYYFYLSKWFPLVGRVLGRHEAAYRYLVDSIVDFPPPYQFIGTINRAGFAGTKYVLLTMGAVAVYTGYKL